MIFTTTAEGGNHHRFVWVEEILCVGGGDIVCGEVKAGEQTAEVSAGALMAVGDSMVAAAAV